MRKNKGVSMITLVITIIVIIILAAIAFLAAGDQVGSGQFARFASEFGDYATNFENDPYANVTESLGLAGKVANKAQKIYGAARDIDLSTFDSKLNGILVPGGYTSTRFQTDIKDATGAMVVLASATTPVYEIKDDVMKEYSRKQFYGNANGKETHWVTAEGKVFTLPGFPRTVDGEDRMYITPELYYVANNGDMIVAGDLTPIEPQKVSGDVVTGDQKATEAADSVVAGEGGETEEPGEEEETINNLADIKVGDFVSYTPNTAASGVQWRVWEVTGSNVVIMPTSPVGNLKLGHENIPDDYAAVRAEALYDYYTAVTQIEALCDNYASSSLGVTESDVRSLTIEDLEDKRVSTLGTQKLSYTNGVATYNDTKPYTSDSYFGARYNESTEKNEISSTFISAPVTLKQTYYYSREPEWEKLPESSATYGNLLGETLSWLASTCVDCNSSNARFDVRIAKGSRVNAQQLFYSDGNTSRGTFGVRPLVSLSSSRLSVSEENPGNGGTSTPWNLVQAQ